MKFLLKYKGKVIVVKVFDDMIPKLKSKIDSVCSIKDGNVTVGVDSIIKELTPKKKENPYSLETFWNTEISQSKIMRQMTQWIKTTKYDTNVD